MLNKSIIFWLPILISNIFLASCNINIGQKSTKTEATDQKTKTSESIIPASRQLTPNLSYIQTAKGALLERLGTRGYYTLTLEGVTPYTTYYTDRPDRDSGLLSTQEFIQSWDKGDNSFQKNNPNVVLTAGTINGVPNNGVSFYLMTCSTPHFNIQNNTLSYVVKPLPKQSFVFEQTKFGTVALVIDSGKI